MAAEGVGAGSAGIAFLVSAEIVSTLVAKACSSPQTTELNAGARAPTLMKWVRIGLIEAAVFVGIAALLDKRAAGAFLAGGLLEGAITYFEYTHAKDAGLASSEPATESY